MMGGWERLGTLGSSVPIVYAKRRAGPIADPPAPRLHAAIRESSSGYLLADPPLQAQKTSATAGQDTLTLQRFLSHQRMLQQRLDAVEKKLGLESPTGSAEISSLDRIGTIL